MSDNFSGMRNVLSDTTYTNIFKGLEEEKN